MKRMAIILVAAALGAGLGCKKKTPKADVPPAAPGGGGAAAVPEKAAPVTSGSVILQRVHFPLDRAELTSEATRTLSEDAKKLLANPALRIRVEGHADERGSTVYNLALSEKRAAVMRRYLVDLGVASSRIETVAYGEERPLVDAEGEEAWAKNRRGDLVVTGSAPTR